MQIKTQPGIRTAQLEWLLSTRYKITNAGEDVRQRDPAYTHQYSHHAKPSWASSRKVALDLWYDPAVPLLICSQRKCNQYAKETSALHAHCSPSQPSSGIHSGWTDTGNVVSVHNTISISPKKKEILSFPATRTELEK